MSSSTPETINRFRKARKLAALFRELDAPLENVNIDDDEQWASAAELTQTKIASMATRALVIEMLGYGVSPVRVLICGCCTNGCECSEHGRAERVRCALHGSPVAV